MPIRSICRALAVAACLLLALPAWSAVDEPAPSSASGVAGLAAARALVDEDRFDEALTILRPLALHHPDHPQRTDILFLLGLAATQASLRPDVPEERREVLLEGAVAAFRLILFDHPELMRVRLELARAFFLIGEDNLSQRHFERVLAGNPPPPVVVNVRLFLNQIRARRRWDMHLGAAIAPDSNIGGTSDEEIIYIGGRPFRRDAQGLTTSGVGLSVWGAASTSTR